MAMQSNHKNTDEASAPSVAEPGTKRCARCGEIRKLTEFLRRTGKRTAKGARRGTCRSCRNELKALKDFEPSMERSAGSASAAPMDLTAGISAALKPQRRGIRSLPVPVTAEGLDISFLRPNRHGKVWMRGRTDKGKRWHQEIDMELAVILVNEYAAVVVNRNVIRRLYTNKGFRRYILARDNHTCYFCGRYGDTIDHLLPKAKGGHTTPMNCVCACNECNQSKADQNLEDFMKER